MQAIAGQLGEHRLYLQYLAEIDGRLTVFWNEARANARAWAPEQVAVLLAHALPHCTDVSSFTVEDLPLDFIQAPFILADR